MRNLCRQFAEWLESEPSGLTETWRAHLESCATCRALWQQEQAYRALLKQVRAEPVPACQLRWEAIALRLQTRPQRRILWAPRFAWGLGIALAVGIAIGLWFQITPRTQNPDSAVRLSQRESASPERAELRWRSAGSEAQPFAAAEPVLTEPKPTHSDGEPEASPKAVPEARMRIARAPEPTSMRGTVRPTATQITMLAPEPIVPLGDTPQTEYLPVRYGEPASAAEVAGGMPSETQHAMEGVDENAIICSF